MYRYRYWAQIRAEVDEAASSSTTTTSFRQLDSRYVSFNEVTVGGDLAGDKATFSLDFQYLTDKEKAKNHAVYIQGYDMSTPDASNWICFMVINDSNNALENFCSNFCNIQRSVPNPSDSAKILLDESDCTDTTYTNDLYSYQTNNAKACPIAQVMSGREEILENYSDGAFLIRPSSQKLAQHKYSDFKGAQLDSKIYERASSPLNSPVGDDRL